MSRLRFSKDHRTYGEWLKAHPKDSKYAKEIIRKHQYFPDKSLNQLRKLKKADYDLSAVDFYDLSKDDRMDRKRSLEVLRNIREGENFTEVLKKRGLKKGVVLKHLGKNLYKQGGTWKVLASDSIQARMKIYSTEGQKVIVTANKKDRILISQYSNSVQKALKNKDPSVLDKFKDLEIIDASGKAHRFQTDLNALHDIRDAQEEPEFQEIYVH
jgi:hypothetical protein